MFSWINFTIVTYVNCFHLFLGPFLFLVFNFSSNYYFSRHYFLNESECPGGQSCFRSCRQNGRKNTRVGTPFSVKPRGIVNHIIEGRIIWINGVQFFASRPPEVNEWNVFPHAFTGVEFQNLDDRVLSIEYGVEGTFTTACDAFFSVRMLAFAPSTVAWDPAYS